MFPTRSGQFSLARSQFENVKGMVKKLNMELKLNSMALEKFELLGICLSNKLKSPFGYSQILPRVMDTFWGYHAIDDCYLTDFISFDTYNCLSRNKYLLKFLMRWGNPRSCPAIMFFNEGLSKAVTLALVGYISIGEYGRHGKQPFTSTQSESGLLLMLATTICYEIGQIQDVEEETFLKRVVGHMRDCWNILDLTAILLLLLWAVLLPIESQAMQCQIVISLSAIPLSFCMLEYLSVVKPLGRLVIMIIAMLADVINFVWVYLVGILGFGITLWGLFKNTGYNGYGNAGFSFVSLFSAMIGNIDFSVFESSPEGIMNTGIVVYVAFVTLVGVVLINLLIARMAGTHDRIDNTSKAEWGYFMVFDTSI
jgi:hypothetical protein